MYATPLFYPIEQLDNNPAMKHFITHFNPMYFYVTQFRDIIYSQCLPQAKYVWAGFAVGIAAFVIGLAMFNKRTRTASSCISDGGEHEREIRD